MLGKFSALQILITQSQTLLIWGLEPSILLSDPQNRLANVKEYLFHYRNLAFENIQGLHSVEAENGGRQFTLWSYAPLPSIF